MTSAGNDIQEHLTVLTASGNIHPVSLSAGVMDKMELNEFHTSSMTPAGSDIG
jgi:hypothetical protein